MRKNIYSTFFNLFHCEAGRYWGRERERERQGAPICYLLAHSLNTCNSPLSTTAASPGPHGQEAGVSSQRQAANPGIPIQHRGFLSSISTPRLNAHLIVTAFLRKKMNRKERSGVWFKKKRRRESNLILRGFTEILSPNLKIHFHFMRYL